MEFNLTTDEGRKTALKSFAKYGALYAAGPLTPITGWLISKAFHWISSPDTIQEQKRVAVDLIKAGRENGVDEMRITLEQTAGVAIGSDVDGIPVKARVGKSGTMTLEVRYRNV